MNRRKWTIAIAALAIMGSGAGLLARMRSSQRLGEPGLTASPGSVTGSLQILLPERVLEFSSESFAPTSEELGVLPRDTTIGRRIYTAPDGFRIQLTAVLMGSDRTSIHNPQFCLTGQGWSIDSRERTTVPLTGPAPYELPVMKLTATKRFPTAGREITRRGLYAYWFVADKLVTADHRERMWWMASELLRTGVLQRWAYVSCFADCSPGEESEAFKRIQSFIAAATPLFQRAPTSGKPPTR
jgi:hypothetical protein